MPTIDEQVELLMQGTGYGDSKTKANMAKRLRERLLEGHTLNVYCGYDPRTTDLHLGHTITMRKLRQFQDLGHRVLFLIGTFTSKIGDPSDVDVARNQLEADRIKDNARTYSEQVTLNFFRCKLGLNELSRPEFHTRSCGNLLQSTGWPGWLS